MLNNWVGMGRLVKDPELSQTKSGVSVCKFTIAVDRDFKNGDEKVTDFIYCTCWRGTAEFVSKYFQKGRMAVVSGELQTRQWEDKDGNKRTSWEIMAQNVYFGDSAKKGTDQPVESGDTEYTGADVKGDDDLPF